MNAVRQLPSEYVDIQSVKPYKGNARIGDVGVIRESLRINGQYRPIVVRRKTKEILAGNHTWKAATQEGWDRIWVTWVDVDAQTARRINLVDNRSAELGNYDEQALLALLQGLPSLEGTGWTGGDMQDLIDKLGAEPDTGAVGSVPDDGYESQLGVIIVCEDQDQQSAVYEKLTELLATDPEIWDGAQLKVVAV